MRKVRNKRHLVSTVAVSSAIALVLLAGSDAFAQQGTPAPAQGAQTTPPAAASGQPGESGQQSSNGQAAQNARVFASDAGMVLNFIKPDKTADFEDILLKLRDAMNRSDKPERKQQAASWKVFRAMEPGANGSVLYVFDIDPAVHGADYTVSTILAEGVPDQVQELFKKYADAYAAGQNVVNLKLVASLGQ
jgi:pyruvate/2-oxoglutarate dehydrogenase complex dihydrolipoamide acyltransferase (E2) component